MTGSSVFDAVREETTYGFENTEFSRKHMKADALRPEDIKNAEAFQRHPPTSKGHMCAQPPVADPAGGEILRVAAYPYADVSEIEGFYQVLEEPLGRMAPVAATGEKRS
ncbi:hypothetical protein PV726_13475 [Streptomyces europaeiscabiei]|uniref:hypothetical protein n=1 Tax=Streptomyces europaeiscabiei TaxID=146819 RepID=UPI0029AC209C|nr:hypothetical protein [Streptomyces europaeiscabiei]MDX3691328.1 hypothetical protein [Streptomyces europaeiscabiei]